MAYSRARRLAQLLNSDGSVAAARLPADVIDGTKIADNAIDSEHYTDGSIDTANIADDQVTLAKLAGLARGKIIYGDSSGNPTALAVGSSGQALTSDGTDVSWGSGGKTTEEIEDIVGAMVSGNTETRFTATYDDTNAKLNFETPAVGSELRVIGRGSLPGAYVDCTVSNATLTVVGRAANISVGVT